LGWIYGIVRAQTKNELLKYFDHVFLRYSTPTSPNLLEINILGNQRYLITREPEHIKTILTGKFHDFGKGPEFHHVCHQFLGNSIFATDGQQWQDSRNLIRPMFMKNRLNDLHIFERNTSLLMKQFPPSGQTFDIMELFYRMSIDIITEFLLGESINSLENPQSEFVKAFTSAQRWQVMLMALA
jgi:cytochrome P450